MAEQDFQNIAGGAVSGAMTGASLGGPWGAVAGLVAGGALSAINGSQKNDISEVDAQEQKRLNDLQRTMKQLQSGSDPLTQERMRQAEATGRTAMGNIAKVTGGDVGGTISAFRQTQAGVDKQKRTAAVEAAQRLPYFDSAAGALTSRIAQRKLELQLLNRAQTNAEQAQAQTDRNVNTNALMGAVLGGVGQDGINTAGVKAPETGTAQTMDVGTFNADTFKAPTQQMTVPDPSVGNVQTIPGYTSPLLTGL